MSYPDTKVDIFGGLELGYQGSLGLERVVCGGEITTSFVGCIHGLGYSGMVQCK